MQRLDLRLLSAWALSLLRSDGAVSEAGRPSASEPDSAWAAQRALLLLAVEVSQHPGGAQLLAGEGFWEHIQVRGSLCRALILQAAVALMDIYLSSEGKRACAGLASDEVRCGYNKVTEIRCDCRMSSDTQLNAALPRMQALSRWLLEPEGGSLLEPPLIEVTSADGDRQLVDYAGAYSEDGSRAAQHELWCLALGVQGDCNP